MVDAGAHGSGAVATMAGEGGGVGEGARKTRWRRRRRSRKWGPARPVRATRGGEKARGEAEERRWGGARAWAFWREVERRA